MNNSPWPKTIEARNAMKALGFKRSEYRVRSRKFFSTYVIIRTAKGDERLAKAGDYGITPMDTTIDGTLIYSYSPTFNKHL